MPLYEYECDSCHQTKEILVRTPDEVAVCPDCGNDQLERLLSIPAAPAVGSATLPLAGRGGMPASCAQPRCCGGGCSTGF